MKITLNNNTSLIEASVKTLLQIKKHPYIKIKSPGAFFSPAFRRGAWDGFVYFMTDRGVFRTGKLGHILEIIEDVDAELEFVDQRQRIPALPIPQKLNGFKLREYQFNAIKAIKQHKIYGVPMPRGILDMATNAGKTIIAAAIYSTYKQPTVFYVKSKELFTQAVRDIEKFIPGELGYLSSSDGEHWNNFMVVMVPSIAKKLDKVGPKLAKFKVVIVDECDESQATGFQNVLKYTYNAYVKIGMSGSVFTDKRAAKKIKNENIRAEFGEVIYKVGNEELIKKGFSSDIDVTIVQGNTKHKYKNDYTKEYLNGIILSKERNSLIVRLAMSALANQRFPVLIMVKNHKHIVKLLKFFSEWSVNIDWVHHKREDRDDVVQRFTEGKIDILIGSYILKRGKNFPLIKTLINAGGGDSMENVLQIIGRATRKSETKTVTYVYDFWDFGEYLRRHSYHRLMVYKKEKFKITHNYKKTLNQ